jgi:hypothetical protein
VSKSSAGKIKGVFGQPTNVEHVRGHDFLIIALPVLLLDVPKNVVLDLTETFELSIR